jgi:methyl-accepting chemotaxis protein
VNEDQVERIAVALEQIADYLEEISESLHATSTTAASTTIADVLDGVRDSITRNCP